MKEKKGKKRMYSQAHLAGQSSSPFDSDGNESDGEMDMKQLVRAELQKYL